MRSEADTRCSLDLDEQDELYQAVKKQRNQWAEKTNAPPTQQDSVPILHNQVQKRYDCDGLLQQKDCTWAFLGDGRDGYTADRYLFWTSLNTNEVGAGKQIPVLILTGDGKYYISETTTGQRTDSNGKKYVAVSGHLYENKEYEDILKAGKKYSTLEEAYDAYVKALAKPEYKGVRDSQTSAP